MLRMTIITVFEPKMVTIPARDSMLINKKSMLYQTFRDQTLQFLLTLITLLFFFLDVLMVCFASNRLIKF